LLNPSSGRDHFSKGNSLLSPVISHYQAYEILEAAAAGLGDVTTSLDLNRTKVKVIFDSGIYSAA